MGADRTSRDVWRVILLSHDDAIAEEICAHQTDVVISCVRVASGYEAAAELLAEPAGGLVIDFRAMAGRHVKLLDIARQLHVAVLGLGELPARVSAAQLSGVQLVSRADLGDAMERTITSQPAPPTADQSETQPPGPDQPPQRLPHPREAASQRPNGEYVPTGPQADDSGESTDVLDGILTDEELDALLGNEP